MSSKSTSRFVGEWLAGWRRSSGCGALAVATALLLDVSPRALASDLRDRSAQRQAVVFPEADGVPTQWPRQPDIPKDAPNVRLIMLDDEGFGASSGFGGVIPTPNFDRLARAGARYHTFNTTAICSPSCASLLTGRNPHLCTRWVQTHPDKADRHRRGAFCRARHRCSATARDRHGSGAGQKYRRSLPFGFTRRIGYGNFRVKNHRAR